MKKSICLLVTLFSTMFFSQSLLAMADYQGNIPSLDDEVKRELADCLDNETNFSQNETGIDLTPKGYDLDSACEFYGFYTEILLETKNLQEASERSVKSPCYVIHFQNGDNIGEVFLYRDADTGEMEISDSHVFYEYDENYVPIHSIFLLFLKRFPQLKISAI